MYMYKNRNVYILNHDKYIQMKLIGILLNPQHFNYLFLSCQLFNRFQLFSFEIFSRNLQNTFRTWTFLKVVDDFSYFFSIDFHWFYFLIRIIPEFSGNAVVNLIYMHYVSLVDILLKNYTNLWIKLNILSGYI